MNRSLSPLHVLLGIFATACAASAPPPESPSGDSPVAVVACHPGANPWHPDVPTVREALATIAPAARNCSEEAGEVHLSVRFHCDGSVLECSSCSR